MSTPTPRIGRVRIDLGATVADVPRVEGVMIGMRYRVVRRPSGRAVTGILEHVGAAGCHIRIVDEAGRHHDIDAKDIESISIRLF